MALKINDEVMVTDWVWYNQASTEVFFLKRGINSANPNEGGNPPDEGPDAIATHAIGSTAYIFTNEWSQAILVPSTADKDKNSFFSIQFKIESVKSTDGTKRFVPSRFEINDINIIYRDKGLR